MAADAKTSGRYEVAVDQWGAIPHAYVKGQVLTIDDIDAHPYDFKWAVENGIVIDLDKQAEQADAENARLADVPATDTTAAAVEDSGSGPSSAPKVTKKD